MPFSALYLTRQDSGVHAEIKSLDEAELPPGDVLIRVSHSTINYKDALAITKGAPVVRSFPMIPGIDLVGTVEESSDPRFVAGQYVLVNGWGLGEERWGGLAEKVRVPGDFVIELPRTLGPVEAMAIGTAGYTAMLSLMTLERAGLTPDSGRVLVTGASGGVGSIAIALLKHHGYEITASSDHEPGYLKGLGATEVIGRAELSTPGKPLQKERWAAAIDCVGGVTAANVCASLKYRGCVAACGLAGSMDFPATVAPFILRNVTLFGIDSVRAPRSERETAWARLGAELSRDKLGEIAKAIRLNEAVSSAHDLLAGKIRGRVIVFI